MCGIVGVAAWNGAPGDDVLDATCDALRHRGPDGRGTWRSPDGRVALAHRRLAVIDLSPAAAQPMQDPTGELTISFNGEIYNFQELRSELAGLGHSFRTRSDTEVLLAAYRAWGPACVSRLQGMFAFALFDLPRRRLFLARDRAGEKPLFVQTRPGSIAFASEIKALARLPGFAPELNLEALDFYLAFGYVPSGTSMLQGIRKLPPGHAATYDLAGDRLEEWAYWELPAPAHDEASTSLDDLCDQLEHRLRDAVRRQLVADVPVGILLSGGVDSSLVAAMATQASSRPIQTFTVTFPGHGAYDEAGFARSVADHLGTVHHELVAEAASVDLLPLLARQFDEPLADSSMVPTLLVSKLIREHATVALGGDGGDELFGGYSYYSWFLRQRQLRTVVPGAVRKLVGAAAARLPTGIRGRNQLIGFAAPDAVGVGHINLYFDAATRRALLRPVLARLPAPWPSPEVKRSALGLPARSPLQAATAADFRSFMVDDILVKVDRASMLASLEVRAPFLDQAVIEFAFGSVPDRYRATPAGERKILLRRLAQRHLPPRMDLRRKQGFSIPLNDWFRDGWGDFFRQVLSELPRELFDPAVVAAQLRGQARGRSNAQRLFALTMFELWRREYGVAIPAGPFTRES